MSAAVAVSVAAAKAVSVRALPLQTFVLVQLARSGAPDELALLDKKHLLVQT
jgi:hypothetical protein